MYGFKHLYLTRQSLDYTPIHKYITAPKSIAFHSDEFTRWSVSQLEGDEVRQVSIDGVSVLLPPYNLDFVFIFTHTWRHFLMGGVGLRQVCDWACYTDAFSDKFDYEELQKIIKRFKLHSIISIFATIAVQKLGVDPEKFLGYASASKIKSDKVLSKIWEGGNFGFYRKREGAPDQTLFIRKYYSLKWHIRNVVLLFTIDKGYTMKFYATFFTTLIVDAIKQYKILGNKL